MSFRDIFYTFWQSLRIMDQVWLHHEWILLPYPINFLQCCVNSNFCPVHMQARLLLLCFDWFLPSMDHYRLVSCSPLYNNNIIYYFNYSPRLRVETLCCPVPNLILSHLVFIPRLKQIQYDNDYTIFILTFSLKNAVQNQTSLVYSGFVQSYNCNVYPALVLINNIMMSAAPCSNLFLS